jgi:hypothetical protein
MASHCRFIHIKKSDSDKVIQCQENYRGGFD